MKISACVVGALGAIALAGCGNVVVGESGGGGSGGSGGSTSEGGGGTTTNPPGCVQVPNQGAPFETTFAIKSTSGSTLYLYQDCSIELAITSCADGYVDAISTSGACTAVCGTGDCIECGACPENAVPVTQGGAVQWGWDGNIYTFGQQNGCTCFTSAAAPGGDYRITISVYTSEADALSHANGTPVSVDFSLPAPNGVVEVDLAAAGF